MTDNILEAIDIEKSFGGVVASNCITLKINRRGIHSIIGPNGAGKTSLLAQLFGTIRPDGGSIRFDGVDVTHMPTHRRVRMGMGRSFQVTSLFPSLTVLENVMVATQQRANAHYRMLTSARPDGKVYREAEDILARIGLADRSSVVASALSYGEQRQLEVGVVLGGAPTVMLMDEPLAGVGGEDAERIRALLLSLKSDLAIVLIEHDMDAVFALSDEITVLHQGRVIEHGDPLRIAGSAAVKEAYLGDDDDDA